MRSTSPRQPPSRHHYHQKCRNRKEDTVNKPHFVLPFAVWQSGFLFVITVRRPTHPLQGCVDCALWTYGRFFQLLRRTLKVACKKNPWSACYDLPNLCSKLCKINLSSRTRNQRLKMLDLKKLHPWSSRVSRFWRKYERHCLHFRDFFFRHFF